MRHTLARRGEMTMNAHETTEIRTLADSVPDEVSGGGEAGYRDGRLHLDFGAGAAGLMPGNGGATTPWAQGFAPGPDADRHARAEIAQARSCLIRIATRDVTERCTLP